MNWRFWSKFARSHGHQAAGTQSCASLDPLLSLYADGMTTPQETHRVEDHLAQCEACRVTQRSFQAIHLVLSQRPLKMPPADLRLRITTAVAAAAAVPTPAPRPLRRARYAQPAYAFALACTVVIVGVSISHLHTASLTGSHGHPLSGGSTVAVNPVLPPIHGVTKPVPISVLIPHSKPLVATALPAPIHHPALLQTPPDLRVSEIPYVAPAVHVSVPRVTLKPSAVRSPSTTNNPRIAVNHIERPVLRPRSTAPSVPHDNTQVATNNLHHTLPETGTGTVTSHMPEPPTVSDPSDLHSPAPAVVANNTPAPAVNNPNDVLHDVRVRLSSFTTIRYTPSTAIHQGIPQDSLNPSRFVQAGIVSAEVH